MSAASFQIDVPELVLARARRGEARALEAIYRAFERPAYTLALRMVGDADSAREVMHDAMLRLIERIGQFRGDAPFWGWLRQIVVNEALMHLRHDARRSRSRSSTSATSRPAKDRRLGFSPTRHGSNARSANCRH